MEKEIRQIIQSMNVGQDREDAETKALSVYKMGEGTVAALLKIAGACRRGQSPPQEKKRLIRAVIFTLSVILKKRQSLFARLAAKEQDVLSLLVDLSEEGFKSALNLLHDLGFSDADIIKIRLRSLPLVDRHANDKVVSMREAVEEIRLSSTYSGPRGMREDHYALGHDGKYGIQLFRIDKNLFALRSRKSR